MKKLLAICILAAAPFVGAADKTAAPARAPAPARGPGLRRIWDSHADVPTPHEPERDPARLAIGAQRPEPDGALPLDGLPSPELLPFGKLVPFMERPLSLPPEPARADAGIVGRPTAGRSGAR